MVLIYHIRISCTDSHRRVFQVAKQPERRGREYSLRTAPTDQSAEAGVERTNDKQNKVRVKPRRGQGDKISTNSMH